MTGVGLFHINNLYLTVFVVATKEDTNDPTEAAGAVYVGVSGLALVVGQFVFMLILDLDTFWKNFCYLKENLTDLFSEIC